MKYRRPMSKKHSKRNFRKGTRIKHANLAVPMRGGIRL